VASLRTLLEPLRTVAARVVDALDPQVSGAFADALVPGGPPLVLTGRQQVVLVGHRSAGKSRLLPLVASHLGRAPVDLDAAIAARYKRSLREWVASDEPGFRAAERATFQALSPGKVVAVGGGFLSLHADLLVGHLAVTVPISFKAYCDRLRADPSRPRLRPQLTLEEELSQVFHQREALHARVPQISLAAVFSAPRARGPFRVVTLPPLAELASAAAIAAETTPAAGSVGEDPGVAVTQAARDFARSVRAAGADLLELRTDLHLGLSLESLASEMPLLISERNTPLPESWQKHASWHDREAAAALPHAGSFLFSHHTTAPLSTEEAVRRWTEAGVPAGSWVKHVEPLGSPHTGARLLDTQDRLIELFGPGRVTVLALGPLALPFRAVLSRKNALDYLAASPAWAAAPGQRLLADAVREARAPSPHPLRLGILGNPVSHSRSPRLHRQPFDRLELPVDVPMAELLEALRPFYAGFAVTSPFKQRVAGEDAVNTLIRRGARWDTANTDVAGARAVLERLSVKRLIALGDGGATQALRTAAQEAGVVLEVCARRDLALHGLPDAPAYVWTWPAQLEAPPLDFKGAPVALIAYGGQARRLGYEVQRRGGTAVRCGAAWFIAQAREQRRLWESAT
jgi:shikimate kinase